MRVLVIGETRFIGPYVVGRLVEEGCEVTVFNRDETVPPLEGVRRLRGDRQNLAGFADEFRKLAPEVVLDMIPMNEREARDLMRVFKGIARRVGAVSSGDVYRAYDRVMGRETRVHLTRSRSTKMRRCVRSSIHTRGRELRSTRRY